MPEILQNKNSATRFQIMVELAASGSRINQRGVARKLGITPQAVSGHLQQLVADGLIEIAERRTYRVSVRGVDWMLKMLRELRDYSSLAAQAVTNITVCAAIAGKDLEPGEVVGLAMKDGVLVADSRGEGGARGIAVAAAKKGEDVGISNVEGLVELRRGKVTILEVPGVVEGGS
ncbi:MAG: winged helix-turn-helix transcriptional regulator, partial [Chloroflexi bacterium]|nr:winged helix-turn-helix transcriptional regulator [Chloroflexota bacterium]